MAKTVETYEVVAGTKAQPGAVLATFSSAKACKCGGPATACLREYQRAGVVAPMYFHRVHPVA